MVVAVSLSLSKWDRCALCQQGTMVLKVQTGMGYVDMNSYQWVVRPNQAKRVRTPFLVTQCKRTAREDNKATWGEGFGQLKRYMKDMVAQHPWRHHQYGIIAVARSVEFYKRNPARSEPVLYAGRYELLGYSAIIHERLMEIGEERLGLRGS